MYYYEFNQKLFDGGASFVTDVFIMKWKIVHHNHEIIILETKLFS